MPKVTPWLMLMREPAGIVRNGSVEERVFQPGVIADLVQKALIRHVAIGKTGHTERSHDPLHFAVSVEDLVFRIAQLVGWIAPGKRFLDREVSGLIDVNRD